MSQRLPSTAVGVQSPDFEPAAGGRLVSLGPRIRIVARLGAATLISTSLAVTLAVGTGFTQSSSGAAPGGGAADRGEVLFNTYGCWQCHGYSGQGGVGPKLAPRPLSFNNFQREVRSPREDMPIYRPNILSNDDLADIYAFVVSIPDSPAAQDIELLNP